MALLLPLTSCGKDNGKPLVQVMTKTSDKGYRKYYASCMTNVKDQKTCLCQANVLKKYLDDDKIMLIADAGNAAAHGDSAKLSELKTEHPEIVDALKRLSLQGADCAGLQ